MRDGATRNLSVCLHHCFSAPEYDVPKHSASRNWFRLVALVGAFAAVPVFAAGYPVCPSAPEPVNWNGGGPVYFYRDIESCRVISWILEPPYWYENTPAEIQAVADSGHRVAFTDQLLAGSKMQVFEYLNTGLDHYFLAIPDEWGAIERGEAGPGWVRTGYGFTARTKVMAPLSVPVARFYGSMWPGPNSHFFTIDPQESLALQRLEYSTPADQPRWNSEGVPFHTFPVLFGGVCAANQIPVWRAFNGGLQRGVESNHRFSTDKSVIDGMVGQGWIMEGIAFCVDTAA